MRELSRLHGVDAGIAIDNVITFHLTPRVDDAAYYRIEERVAQLPGVDAAGLIHMVPLQNWGGIGTFQVRGRPPDEPTQMPTAELRSVTPGYFDVLGIPIRRGRGVTERDSSTTPTPILINDALARLYFPDEDPVGRELNRGTIVGVVGDVRHAGLDSPALPQIYSPVNRHAGIASDIGMSLLVRFQGSPEAVVAAVRNAVREVNPSLAIFNIKTMAQIVADSLWELRLYRWLVGLFAALALLLAAIGLYGVIAYSATTRVREFAVRLALGSDPIGLARLVMARGVGLASAGLLIGALIAMSLTRVLRELPATFAPDAGLFAAVSGLVLAIALLACLVPALRVTRVDPATALRHE
jgi:putative ABC transport system permease protein